MTSAGAARHLSPSRPTVLAGGGDRSRPSTPRTPGTRLVLGIAGPAGPQHRPLRRSSTSPGCARRSSGGPGSGSPPATRSPRSAPARQAMARFSLFLAERTRASTTSTGITRDRCSRTTCRGWRPSATGRPTPAHHTLTFIKVFLDWGHRHGTLPGLPADAVIYDEEVTRPPDHAARSSSPSSSWPSSSPTPTWPGCRNPTVAPPRRGADGDRPARRRRLHARVQPDRRRQRRLAVPALRQHQGPSRAAHPVERQGRRRRSAPNKTTSASAGRRARRGCSPASSTTPTAPSPTPTAALSQPARPLAEARSTCATKPASRAGSTPTSSATPSAPGSSTPACPSTSSRSCSATPAPA